MIAINSAHVSERENYKLLTGAVVPRPIAFVTTLSQFGVLNGAPFSYFSVVSSKPPMLAVSVGRRQGRMKDTARNAIDGGAFVVHVVDENNVALINETAAGLPPDTSEVDLVGFKPVASKAIRVPGIQEAAIRMECTLERVVPIGGTEEEPANDLLIGRVVYYHFAENIYDEGAIRSEQLRPVARMSGNDYIKMGKLFSIERP